MQEEVLLTVKKILDARGKRLKSLAIFGSSISNPLKARDIDILIVVDRLSDALEKFNLEIEIARALRTTQSKILFDIIVFDDESFRENLEPGALASGLIAGYRIIYDELGLEKLLNGLVEKIACGEYIVQKSGRRINLSALARAKLRLSHAKSGKACKWN